jgi:hypothetical protein
MRFSDPELHTSRPNLANSRISLALRCRTSQSRVSRPLREPFFYWPPLVLLLKQPLTSHCASLAAMIDKFPINRFLVGSLIMAATLLLLASLPAIRVIQFRNDLANSTGCRYARPDGGCSLAVVADTGTPSVVIGEDRSTLCATYSEQPGVRPSIESWVLGFLITQTLDDLESGFTNSFAVVDQGAVPNWLQDYCRSHPLDSVSLASAWLVSDLRLGIVPPQFRPSTPRPHLDLFALQLGETFAPKLGETKDAQREPSGHRRGADAGFGQRVTSKSL